MDDCGLVINIYAKVKSFPYCGEDSPTRRKSTKKAISAPAKNPENVSSRVSASCLDTNCPDEYHWVLKPPGAVSGTKCWYCGGQLIWDHKTKTATYKGRDWCICNGCTIADLIKNSKDSKRGRK